MIQLLLALALTIVPCIEVDTPVRSDDGHVEGWAYPDAYLYIRVFYETTADVYEITADEIGRFYLEVDLADAVYIQVTDGIRCHAGVTVESVHKIFLPVMMR
jgi:hypothetical protein